MGMLMCRPGKWDQKFPVDKNWLSKGFLEIKPKKQIKNKVMVPGFEKRVHSRLMNTVLSGGVPGYFIYIYMLQDHKRLPLTEAQFFADTHPYPPGTKPRD